MIRVDRLSRRTDLKEKAVRVTSKQAIQKLVNILSNVLDTSTINFLYTQISSVFFFIDEHRLKRSH